MRMERNSQQAGAETRARAERERTQSLSKHATGTRPPEWEGTVSPGKESVHP